ncbi:PREDICTED: cubilin-like, partial [Ceratosolen solmsi marchali]|uniref:Cubilin n=1 Tax=Ceratosolen solmsi marchali TaxID=326594 RepID=A0AAJ6YLG7_9HYME
MDNNIIRIVPVLETINGNLYITSAKDKNITLKTLGNGNLNINEINLLHIIMTAQNASRLVERWKLGILNDIESTIQRLTRIIEGPNGLIRKMNSFEYSSYPTVNNSKSSTSSSIIENKANIFTTFQVRSINNRLRRLEKKFRTITVKLRTNECLSDPCQNGATCIDHYDTFQCQCTPEWEGTLCTKDVNECERLLDKPSGCQNGATCVNLPGSFSCTCTPGWHGFHCSTQKSICDQSNNVELCGNGICVRTNSPLGYTCICKPGWDHLDDHNPSCRKDVDECTISRYPCSINPFVTCHNVPGTFYCGVCPSGFTGDGFKCQDIDECSLNNGGCSTTPLVECLNTLGSRKCGPCPNGFRGDGITCFYVGSCAINNGGCHSLATCKEGPNSETFCLCSEGYQGSGKGPQGCTPVHNACTNNPCIHGTCSSHGTDSFICICNDGYTGTTCNISISPCVPNPCQNSGVCRITIRGNRFCECTASFAGSTCSIPKPSCGGFFRSSFGYIEFPIEIGSKYDHGLSCAWVILTNHTMVLNVTFTRFALEDSRGSDECKHDYVQIHDGRSAGKHILGRYCGDKLPNNGTIISTHNSLYIWFHSDSTINSDGFALNWTTIEPLCGGDINQEHGSITSPGFPGKYPNNRNCYWNIHVSAGKRIALHFTSLMIEEHATCQFDYVEINETTYIGEHRLGIFCNHSKPEPITTSGSNVIVHFHSDNSGADSGFHLSFLSIPGAPDCGGIYTSESGEITSPKYSGNYRSGMICDWEIRLPETSNVRINWLNFDVESSRNCMFDSVQIYEGLDINSPLIGKYCGSVLPPPVSIKSNKILIRFESDANLEEQGFSMKYEVECGGIFTEPSGVLNSPFYPNYYPALKDYIEVGGIVNNHTECDFDRLEIRDGDMKNSTLLLTLCGSLHNILSNPIYSTQNYMYIEFFTDANIQNRGFKANYTTIDSECGGIYNNAPGTINVPGNIGKWRFNIDCFWTIHAPSTNAIQITWTSFPNQHSRMNEDCKRNYIELIEDYRSTNSKSLGKYCPLKAPPLIMTTQGNDLTLHYRAGHISDIDYQATYVFINNTYNCGGHYFAEMGYIRSPNYPKKYPKNKECIWIIEAQNKYLISLNFGSFDLENSTKCSNDYLEIRSGSQDNSPLLGKFCGIKVENEITSMTNQIYIKFVTDSSLQNQGFEIQWRSTKTGCGGNLHTSSGAIISPNYPQNYYHQAICTWNIRISAGSIIRIAFIDFDIEDHVKCSFDYIEISDIINGYMQNTQRFCGSIIPPFFLSNSNQIKLVFRSDVLASSRGFHLRYTTECINKVTGFQGVIESPNFPQSYENLSNCSWIISVPIGNRINITFSHFNIQPDLDDKCDKNYIRIQEGDRDKPNTEILKKCGSEEDVLPLKISSKQRQVFITFVSDRFQVGSGFRLEWNVNGCSEHLTKFYGQFTSPGFPNGDKLPYSNIICEWLIEVDFEKSIEITFATIETTKTRACLPDSDGSIEIYNGPNKNAPQIVNNLCYSNTPVTFTSTGNQMLIKYSSTVEYASHGFKAIYHAVNIKCGGKFTGQTGVIHSVNYPKNYPHNQNCEWLIIVDVNHAVNVTFVDLDLEKSRNCSDDYIKIYDGNKVEAPLLGKHCQSVDLLPSYISSGNQMLIIMRTDSFVSAKGFKAYYNRTCGARIIVDSDGFIRSSRTLHTTFLNCSWILTAKDPSNKIVLTFNHIDLLVSDCSSNHIEIYEGEGIEGPLLGQICSNKIPSPYFSSGNALTIHLIFGSGDIIGDNFEATYSTFTSACGGKYTAESGIIVSPNYPLSYPNKADCIWIISNSPGNKVSLIFENFELINSDNCDMDYLEIRDNNGIGKLQGVFCGNNFESITSSQSLWIRFKTSANTIGNPKGFKSEYHLLFGDELTGDYGEIASPMYPLPYRKSETFSWRITVDFNYIIRIQFLDFNFYSIDFYDGFNDDAPQIMELCGISTPSEPLTSSGNIIFIKMENSFDHVGNWFHLKWLKIPRLISNENLEEIINSKNSKLILLTEHNGTYTFNSPGYPNGYEDNIQYSWTFVSPVGTHLVLKFLTIDLEESEDCITDYVAIYKGYSTSFESNENLLKKVCLSNSTMSNFPSTNVMTVQFITDAYRNESGFSAVVVAECGGTIEESNGFIQVSEITKFVMPRLYTYTCEWIVKVRSGRRINVKIVENHIENSRPKTKDNSCTSNYLMLKNGESSSSPLLGIGKYCNGIKPPIQNTSSNYLYVKLVVSLPAVNFKLAFRELGHDCGGRFELSAMTASQQEITSPNYPNIPTPHTECFWTFMNTNENRLTINFLDRFDLAFSENCEQEYIEIRDGGTDTSPLLGRYCKNTPPSSLSTKGNIMYIHYFTDLMEPRNGFKALVTSGDICGGIERETRGGIITSPNYPNSYTTKSYFCSWWIIAPSSNRGIKLQFQDLKLPFQRNCTNTDHVVIYEKIPGNFNSTEIGTYCGKRIPGVIEVLTNEAMVVFKSSLTNIKQTIATGFRLNYTFNHNRCGSILNGMSGNFQTDGYPRSTSYKFCNWKISVQEGFQIIVDIIDLDLGEDRYVMDSRVSFYHDPDSIALIKLLRNSTQSMRIASSSNFMSIYFISTGSSRGMKAKYFTSEPAPCGQKLNNWEGTLTSPRLAIFNESAFYCKWIIQQPETFESIQKIDLTLAITISGTINKGKGSVSCWNYLGYIFIKGDEPVAKICGNFTKNSITIASPFRSYSIEAVNATHMAKVNFIMKYKWYQCGGILNGPSHIIQAPINMSHPVYCAWKIKYPNIDDSILINFTKMNLSSCDKSYIQIKGRTYRSPHLGKFCGNEIPQNIVSPANEFMMEYYSNENFANFEIHLEPAKYACGGIIKGKETEIMSPGFPQGYSNNTECIWEIVANVGYHIGIKFIERFNLETSTNCKNDFIDEWSEELQNKTNHWKNLGRICGRSPPEKPFNTSTNKMKIKFVSNDRIEGEGFKAVWYQNCGGVYEATQILKYIQSPNFLYSLYPSNIICNYTLIAPNDQEIIVDFTDFYLEGNSITCPYDNLTIFFYTGDWMRNQNTWCGNNSPGKKMSKGRMEIIFRTDNSINRLGFKFKYSVNDCGGLITNPRIINPHMVNDPGSYEYMNCIWVIKAPPIKSILLRFEKLKILQPLGSCISSFVRIYEGNSTQNNKLKATFCGDMSKNLPVLQSDGNIMTIFFHTSSYGENDHFLKAAILFVNGPEEGCGGNINVSSVTQFRTQLSNTYDPFQDCQWLIFSPQGYNIQFTINQLDLKNSKFNETQENQITCNSDYMEVRDGGPYAELIGIYCGNKAPPPILTSSNLLWIRFVSDGINQGQGVKGLFQIITSPCGISDLSLGNDTRILTSPNYPDDYTSDIICRWVIRASSGRFKRIRIVFKDFYLKDSKLCEKEYLQIADMDNREIISEGFGEQLIIGGTKTHHHNIIVASRNPQSYYKYCGSNIPHDYYSNYRDVEITYKALFEKGKRQRFKFEYGRASCSHNYTELQGRIIHEDITDCWVTIQVPVNYTINLYFNHFFLPGTPDCSEGNMQIREGLFNGHIIQTICNYETPNPVFSQSNRISFHAFSNKEMNYRNNVYDITYTSTKNGRGCGGKIYNYGGVFTSPLYPSPYRNKSSCKWDINVPRGMKVLLHFDIFDIGTHAMCFTDYLTLSEIRSNEEEVITTYCGGDIPADFTSQSDQVFITY